MNNFYAIVGKIIYLKDESFNIQIPPPYEPQPESLFGTYEPEAEMEARPETLLWSWSHSAWERSNERTRYFAYYDLPNLLVPSAAPLRVQLIYFPFVDFVAALRGQKLVSHNAKLHQGD